MTIFSNHPIILLISQAQWDVTVSDPTQTLKSVTLNFSANFFGGQASIWNGASHKSMNIYLPQGGSAGSSITKSLL